MTSVLWKVTLPVELQFEYGGDRQFTWTVASNLSLQVHRGPEGNCDPRAATTAALLEPLDFPPLTAALVDGDRVVLAMDRQLPAVAEIVAGIWPLLASAGIEPRDLLILQPAAWDAVALPDPRAHLPESIRSQVRWAIHDPTASDSCAYLASSAGGERLYLARELIDADFVLPITQAGFDPLLGYRTPAAILYPGLSNTAAIAKAHGQGHSELRPEDDRPLRQLIDEVGWLAGVQLVMQVIPGRLRGTVQAIFAGSVESVSRAARQTLDRDWRFALDERTATVVVSVPSRDPASAWEDLAAALEAAQGVVTRGGRIIALTDLSGSFGPGFEIVRSHSSPRGALKALRDSAPPDWLAAARFAQAVDWARLYLLSRLDPDIAEDLFVVPLSSESELERVLSTVEPGSAVISVGPLTWGAISQTSAVR